jgi:hypothetical protein
MNRTQIDGDISPIGATPDATKLTAMTQDEYRVAS